MENTPNMQSLKMLWEHFQATKEKTSGQSSKPSLIPVKTDWIFLDLRRANGAMQEQWQEMDGASLGEFITHNTGESPSVAEDCTLLDVLEPNAPQKYYLSAKACQGILNRGAKRGKDMPLTMKEALEEVVSLFLSEQESLGEARVSS